MKIGLKALRELREFTNDVPAKEKILYLGLIKTKWWQNILFPWYILPPIWIIVWIILGISAYTKAIHL